MAAFFKYTGTKICFSDIIAQSKNVNKNDGAHRYRIRVSNFGSIDLMDVETRTTIRIRLEKDGVGTVIAPAVLGSDGMFTRLQKQPAYSKVKQGMKYPYCQISTIFLTDKSMREYQKSFYDTEVQQKAASGTLSLDDLFDTYKGAMTIRILLHGTDVFSGRRIFAIKEYKYKNIKQGIFVPLNDQWKQEKDSISTASAYKKWLEKALSKVEKETEQ